MRYYKHGFLNKAEGFAAFEAIVDYDGKEYSSIDASFAISDCNRKVSLEFYVYDDKSFKEASHKVEKLINELVNFRDNLDAARVKHKHDKDVQKEKK